MRVVSWEHELALILIGFAGGVLFTLGVWAASRPAERRGNLELDTPEARRVIGRRPKPW